MAPSLRELLASTPLSGGNAPYVEALYEQFLHDPQTVDAAWRDYFSKLQDGLKQRGNGAEQIHSAVQAGIVQRAGKPRIDAWRSMAQRVKLEEIEAFVAMLWQSERFGTPIVRALATFAESLRTTRRQQAEAHPRTEPAGTH